MVNYLLFLKNKNKNKINLEADIDRIVYLPISRKKSIEMTRIVSIGLNG